MSGVIALHTSGNVFVVREKKKKKIVAQYPDMPAKFRDGDRVITGSDGYIVDLSDEAGKYGTWMHICPNTEIVLKIKRSKMIVGVYIIRGTCYLGTNCPVTVPLAEVSYPLGASNFMVRVEPRTVSIAAESTPLNIKHKTSKKEIQIFPNQQAVVTEKGISGPYPVDINFKNEYRAIQAVRSEKLDATMKTQIVLQYQNIPVLIEDILGTLESQLWILGKDGFLNILDSIEKSIMEAPKFVRKTLGDNFFDEVLGRIKIAKKRVLEYDDTQPSVKKDIDELEKIIRESEHDLPPKIVKLLKDTHTKFKKLVDETMKKKDKKVITTKTAMETKKLNISRKYRDIQIVVYSISIGTSYKGRILKDKKFLVVNIGLRNISKRTQFLFPFEEIRLEIESENIIDIDNDYIEHELPPGKEIRGDLIFIVPRKKAKYTLLIGKKKFKKIRLI